MCTTPLLHHVHKNATSNIVFNITYTRISSGVRHHCIHALLTEHMVNNIHCLQHYFALSTPNL